MRAILAAVLVIGGLFNVGCTGLMVRADDAARILRESAAAAATSAATVGASLLREAGGAAVEAAMTAAGRAAEAATDKAAAAAEKWAERQRAPDGGFPATPAGLAALIAITAADAARKWKRDRVAKREGIPVKEVKHPPPP